jgi:small subunit ribosomal protein S8
MMNMTDPIADMLTRIRNAVNVRHEVVEVPASKEKLEIARILKEEGFITSYEVSGDIQKTITIALKYGPNKERVETRITRIRRSRTYPARP